MTPESANEYLTLFQIAHMVIGSFENVGETQTAALSGRWNDGPFPQRRKLYD